MSPPALFPARICVLLAGMAACSLATAQQRPLTGQMLSDPAHAPVAVPSRPPPPPAGPEHAHPALPPTRLPVALPLAARPAIGDTTRALLQLQAGGTHAGARLPILGDQAALSYARYLDSFTHPIPEFLDARVRDEVTGGSGN